MAAGIGFQAVILTGTVRLFCQASSGLNALAVTKERNMVFLRIAEGMAKRASGPMGFRIIIQPVIAIALGIRDGLMDANAGEYPYFIGLLFHPECRRELWARTLKNILKPFIAGVILDMILQYFIFQRVRLIPAIILGFVLIGLPYSIARGITNRVATKWRQRRTGG